MRIEVTEAACKEYDDVVMLMDNSFIYDEYGYLRHSNDNYADQRVRRLFHGLSRAKKRVALLVYDNAEVFKALLSIVQR